MHLIGVLRFSFTSGSDYDSNKTLNHLAAFGATVVALALAISSSLVVTLSEPCLLFDTAARAF